MDVTSSPSDFSSVMPLRIDVDFPSGLRKGLPRMLDMLAKHEMQATFFIVAGHNRPGKLAGRLKTKEYRSRIQDLDPVRIFFRFFLPELLSSSKDMMCGLDDQSGLIRRLISEGHEVAVHGYDHRWWADHVWQTTSSDLKTDIDKAYVVFETFSKLGSNTLAWGSPSWRTTDDVIELLAERGVPYLSDCWGYAPFYTRLFKGEIVRIPHLPITVQSFEASPRIKGSALDEKVSRLVELAQGSDYAMTCMHDYFEGLMRPDIFKSVIERLAENNCRTISLKETAERVADADLPTSSIIRQEVSGFTGQVSVQEKVG